MRSLKRLAVNGVLAATLAAGAWAGATAPASAAVVCNRWGDCWHTDTRVAYPGHLGIVYHDDSWRRRYWNHRYHWREPGEGRGYYRRGVWIGF